MDSTWFVELDKFLNGEESKIKEHKNWVNYEFQFKDKSFPSGDMARDLMAMEPKH